MQSRGDRLSFKVEMSFDLRASIVRARRRQRGQERREQLPSGRARRVDAGESRLHPEVRAELARLLGGYDRPKVSDVRAQLARFCARRGLPEPSRAAVYAWIPRAEVPRYRVGKLPSHIRELIHNLDDGTDIPGSQLVAVIVNNGDARALSFAAGMPWLCLVRAVRLRDFRPKSYALLQALLRGRGL